MSRYLLLAAVTGSLAAGLAAQGEALPSGVTTEMITAGQRLFAGPGLCMACHGPEGRGMPNMAPDLGDAEWLHGDGSFAYLVRRILAGVPADSSTTGIAMPPRGGSRLTDEQVRAVAAYVWSLRRSR